MAGIEAYVSLIPSFAGFGPKVKSGVASATKTGASVTVTPEMTQFAKGVSTGVRKTKTTVDVPVEADTSKLSKQLGSEGRSSGKLFGGNFTSTVGGVFTGGALLGLAKEAGQAIMGQIGGAIEQSDATDKFKQALNFAGVQSKQIGQIVAQAQTYANQTVYNLSDIQSMTGQLVSNGIAGGEKLAESLGNLNAVAGGTADTYKELGLVLTQTNSLGKLNTQNWDQFANDLPGASGILKKELLQDKAYTGDFSDALATGQISADEFNKALTRLGQTDAAKQAATSTKTIAGSWGNMQAAITGGLAQIITKLKPTITMIVNGLTPAVTDLANQITKDVLPPVTGLFDFFSKHITTVKVLGAGFGSLAGSMSLLAIGGVVVSKVVKGAQGIQNAFKAIGGAGGPLSALKQLRSGVDEAGNSLSTFGKFSRGMQVGLPLVGIAIAGVSTIMAAYKARAEQARQDTQSFSDAFAQMKSSADNATDALNKNLRAVAVNQLQQKGAFKDASTLGLSYSTVTDAALGVSAAQDKVNAALDAAHSRANQTYVDTQGNTVEMGKGSKAADNLANSLGYVNDRYSAGKAADDVRRSAMKSSTTATQQATGAQSTWAQMVGQATNMVKGQNKQLEQQRQDLLNSANAALTASGDQIAYKQSIKDATDAVKQNGRTLDENTQKGRDNRTALNNLASSSLTYIQDLIKNKASTDKVTSATQSARGEFIRTAEQMGATKDQAKQLADQYGLIPKKIATQIDDPGYKKVKQDLNDIITTIAGIHGKTVTVKYNVNTGASTASYTGGTAVASSKAGGGPISGPGTGTSDSVLIRASNGEYMQTAEATSYYGTGTMDAIRSMRIPKEVLAAYASGGPIRFDQSFIGNPAAFSKTIAAAEASVLKYAAKHAQPSGPSGNAVGALQQYALSLFPAHGWTADMFGSLKALWNGESGWNPRAYNAASGATGIPQALPGSKMASAGADWRTNGGTQIRWGEGYIGSVYGNPVNAYRKWLGRDPHWYAAGTSYALAGDAIVGENGPERVTLRGGERIDSAGKTRQELAAPNKSLTINLHYGPGLIETIRGEIDQNDEFNASIMRTTNR